MLRLDDSGDALGDTGRNACVAEIQACSDSGTQILKLLADWF